MKQVYNGFLALLLVVAPNQIFADEVYKSRDGKSIRIAVAKSIKDIDVPKAKDILVRSFMDVYEDVPLTELNPKFKSTGDVRRFYRDYFESELGHFVHGDLLWVQAFLDNQLVGWATFEGEPDSDGAAYMNLLIVAPEHQGRGIGRFLTFSIRSKELLPKTKTIHLLLRKVNQKGRGFYERLGFFENKQYSRTDNFVDMTLLTPMTWNEKSSSDGK